ncbi:hypothetical protein CpipJ_CPIJ014006, partial [Culex quinquefasciatus]
NLSILQQYQKSISFLANLNVGRPPPPFNPNCPCSCLFECYWISDFYLADSNLTSL